METLMPESTHVWLEEAAINIRIYSYELLRPSFIHKPTLGIDGNKWCALYGPNLMEGITGFGDSPDEAYRDFDKNWYEKLK